MKTTALPPPLPAQVETLDAIQRRFPLAVEDVQDFKAGPVVCGLDRKYVFDFESGLRLIACREINTIGPKPYDHLSFSVLPGFFTAVPGVEELHELETQIKYIINTFGYQLPCRANIKTPHALHFWFYPLET